MVATASTEHLDSMIHWLALAFLAVFFYATYEIGFEWKPGFYFCNALLFGVTSQHCLKDTFTFRLSVAVMCY